MGNVHKSKASPARRYHSVSRVAREIDASDGYIHKLIREGALEAVRIRRMVRVTDESYRKFLATLKREPVTMSGR
jgi:hypothetical protein